VLITKVVSVDGLLVKAESVRLMYTVGALYKWQNDQGWLMGAMQMLCAEDD
jgi:hypothetical protein